MNLMGLIVATGSKRIGQGTRSATLAVYNDGTEVFRFDADFESGVKVADQYEVQVTKK